MTELQAGTAPHDDHTAPAEAWDEIAALYDEHVAPGESELATAGLRLAGLAAEGRVMDCHALDLPDNSFDVTGSVFGVMLVPDQPRALREMARVTKPGGRVLLIAYGNPAEFEAFHFFLSAVQAVVPEFEGPAEDEPLLEFQVADPDVLRRRLVEAGLRDVVVDTSHQERITVHSGQQLWDWTIGSNPVPGALVAELTNEQRADIIRILDGMLRERSGAAGPAVLTAPLNIGVGTK